MTKFILSLGLLVASISFHSQINSNSPKVPFGSNTSYKFGIMPSNLPSSGTYGRSNDAANAYNNWKTKYVANCNSGSKRVLFDDNSSTVSEGIAYGMLLSAYAGDKPLFDSLWKYYKENTNSKGIMHWKISGCSGNSGNDGATDAELDAAMALIVAETQWPTATSPYDYKNEATLLIEKIRKFEIHPTSKQTLNGDGWGDQNTCRNPSYFSPAYYREYGKIETSQKSFWDQTITATDTYLTINRNSTTGLVSNWSDQNAAPNSCNGPNEYGYDACRNPWRMATDVTWNGSVATTANDICNKLANWAKGYGNNLRGPLSQNASNPSVGGNKNGSFSTFAAVFMAAGSTYQSDLNSAYSSTVGLNGENYFNDTLRCVTLFQLTGNFWNPSTLSANGNIPNVSLASPSPTNACLNLKVTLNATATDSDGTITKVEFFEDGVKIGEKTSAPFSLIYTLAKSGNITFSAKAYDNSGNSSISTGISFNVSTIVSPDGVSCVPTSNSNDWKGFIDDFDTVSEVTVGGTTAGLYWAPGTDPAASVMYKFTRATTGMKVGLTNANKETYHSFTLKFGGTTTAPNTINVKELSNSNIKINLTNTTNADIFLVIQLKDTKGGVAEIIPADGSTITWANKWAKTGVRILRGETKDFTIDLSSRANELGGLSAVSWGCLTAPTCPQTAYNLDATKISEVIFIVNGGAGKDDMTLQPATGDLVFNYMSLGDVTTQPNRVIKKGLNLSTDIIDELSKSVNVYPIPSKGSLYINQVSGTFESYQLFNMRGQLISSNKITSEQTLINTEEFENGFYILEMKGEKGSVHKKIVLE